MPIKVIVVDSFEAFMYAIRERPIRLVKLADYGFVAPLKTSSGAVVMAPQTKVVATAFDLKGRALIRWQSARRTNSAAAVTIGKGSGSQANLDVVARKEDLQKWLELEGFSVSDGEWDKDDIERLVSGHPEQQHQV